MKTILIQNFHYNSTRALINDFIALGYEVVMPVDNWGGKITTFHSNIMFGQRLISEAEYYSMPSSDLLIGCREQEVYMLPIAQHHGDRIIIHTAQNEDPYQKGYEYVLASDILFYNSYSSKNKMLYFTKPPIHIQGEKDLQISWNGEIKTFIHSYAQYFPEGYQKMQELSQKYQKVLCYGDGNEMGAITELQSQSLMLQSKFTLYFKDRDCYGYMPIESMLLGTPLISLWPFIKGKTLGEYFIKKENAVVGETVDEVVDILKRLTFEQYCQMSWEARVLAEKLTDKNQRLDTMKHILDL